MGVTQKPPVHGTPLQQSPATVHCWPYCAQFVPPLLEPPEELDELDELLLLLVVPPSGGGVVVEAPQTPFAEPAWRMHGSPLQQSAVVVQPPAAGTHPAPHLLSTQGWPQQSALVAHTEPAGGGFPVQSTGLIRQRGMPSASRLQQFSGLLLQ
jgi:hypothetical protein